MGLAGRRRCTGGRSVRCRPRRTARTGAATARRATFGVVTVGVVAVGVDTVGVITVRVVTAAGAVGTPAGTSGAATRGGVDADARGVATGCVGGPATALRLLASTA